MPAKVIAVGLTISARGFFKFSEQVSLILWFGFGLSKERLLVLLLSWCIEMRSKGDVGMEAAYIAAWCQGSQAMGHRLQKSSKWREIDPLKSYCCATKVKPATLGLSKKCQLFTCLTDSSALVQSSGCAASRQAGWLPPSSLDLSVPPGQAGGEVWLPSKTHPVMQSQNQVSAGIRDTVPMQRQPSLRCLHQTGVHLPERDWEQQLQPHQPGLASATEHLAHGTQPSRQGKYLQLRKPVQRGWVLTGATHQVVQKQWYFSRHSYWASSRSPSSLCFSLLPYFWFSDWEVLCTYL